MTDESGVSVHDTTARDAAADASAEGCQVRLGEATGVVMGR